MRPPQVFEMLWGTNELLSSFDSINCLPPSSSTGIINDQTSWLHADQAPLRRGFFCIQVMLATHNLGLLYSSEGLVHCHEGLGTSNLCAYRASCGALDACCCLMWKQHLCRDLLIWWM